MIGRRPWLWVALAALMALAPAWMAGKAVAAGSIRQNSSFGTTVKYNPKGSIYTIDGGTLAGSNLFESFSDFSLAVKATALWTYSGVEPSSGIANVINLVTGDRVSDIDGMLTLDSTTLPRAAFYFINPAGVVFGKGASVDVPGAAYFSTAKQLVFTGGAVLTASTATGSTLSMAQPAAFGFLGGQGNITMTGGAIVAPAGQVFLAAGALKLSNVALKARGLDLFAVGNQGRRVSITNPMAGPALGGDITISSGKSIPRLTANGGTIVVDANVLTIGQIESNSDSARRGGDITIDARSITLNDHARIQTEASGSDRGGDIDINARSVTLDDSALIQTETSGSGRGGNITINDTGALIEDSGRILSLVAEGAHGRGGDVAVQARTIALYDGALLGSRTSGQGTSGQARAGDVTVKDSGRLFSDDGRIFSTVFIDDATGRAGDVLVHARNIYLVDGSVIESDTLGTGNAGNIDVYNVHDLLINDAVISGSTNSSGHGGDITVDATNITIAGCGRTQTCPILNCGEASCPLTCGSFTCDCGGYSCGKISASAFSGGNAGGISVTARRLVVDTGGVIRSNTGNTLSPDATGNGGAVGIAVDTLVIQGGGGVESDAIGPGHGGNLSIHGDNDTHAAVVRVQDSLGCNLTTCSKISASALGDGNAGKVSVTTNSLIVRGYGAVETNAGQIDPTTGEAMGGSGNAGRIAINAGTIAIQSGGSIESGTLDSGGGGNVSIKAQTISVQDSEDCKTSSCAQISASASADGTAGKLSLKANAIEIRGGGAISTSTGLLPVLTGGDVPIPAATGNAGAILLNAPILSLESGGTISSDTWDEGQAGRVTVSGSQDVLVDGGSITVGSDGKATGGTGILRLRAGALSIINGGSVSTNSVNQNPAGGVTIGAPDILIDGKGSTISSANLGDSAGAAGAERITTNLITISNGGSVSTNASSGAAGDITLTVDHGGVLTLEGAQSSPGTITTSSRAGEGGRITISDPLAIISNGGEILAQGDASGAYVNITSGSLISSSDRTNQVIVSGTLVVDSKIVNVSQDVTLSDIAFEDASRVLQGQCPALQARGETSQLGMTLDGPYAPLRRAEPLESQGGGDQAMAAPAPERRCAGLQ